MHASIDISLFSFLLLLSMVLLLATGAGFFFGKRWGQQTQRLESSERLGLLQAQVDQLQALREHEQASFNRQQTSVEEHKQQLSQALENVSHRIMERSQRQAFEQHKQLQQQGQQGLTGLLTPFKEQLDGLRKKVDEVHIHDAKDRASLKTQIGELAQLNQNMGQEAQALTQALRGDKKAQGNWGELVLEQVLERSGLRAGEEFVREQGYQADDGKQYRPDVIINLPDNKHIIVDAKVSLNAYQDSVGCDDEEARQRYLTQHAQAIGEHIKTLSAKCYQQLPKLNSPDFVFLFMPIEPAFIAAFQQDEGLFDQAFEQGIVIVTPTTLLASLRTVASIWSLERRGQSGEKLADQASKLYDRLRIVVEKMQKLGSQLQTAQKTYDETFQSLAQGRGNLVNQVQSFSKLGVRIKKELPKDTLEQAQQSHEDALLFSNEDTEKLLADIDTSTSIAAETEARAYAGEE